MSKKRGGALAPIVILVLAVALLVALNPTQVDFKEYYRKSAQAGAAKSVGGGVGNLLGSIASGAAGIVADAAFSRTNLGVASVYASKDREGKVQRAYLGVAKLFVKVK